jgi:16S rRNA (guanine966-N2)-methyltransferase
VVEGVGRVQQHEIPGAAVGDQPIRAEVVVADGPNWLVANCGPWDLVLLDPPYAFDGWPALLGGPLVGSGAGMVVVESDREVDPGPSWNVGSTRRHGSTVVTLLTPTD